LHDVPVNARQETGAAATRAPGRRSIAQRIGLGLEENGTLVLVVAAFAAVLVVDLRNLLVTDGWMALLSGQAVAQHGLPAHDTLTVWANGHTWVDQQWLAQLALYELYRLGGLTLVLLVHAALVIAGVAGAATLARRFGASARSTTWMTLPVLLAFWRGAVIMRPQSFAYVLLVGVLWLVLDDERRPSRRVFFVLPLLALWANLHGSVVVGSALVSGYALVAFVGSLRKKPRTIEMRSLALLAAPWACVLASPYATSLPHYYREVFSNGFASNVTEWAPTTLTVLNAPVYALSLGGLWLLGRTATKTTSFEKLAFLGLSILAFDAVRNAVWLALVSLVVLPRLVDALRAPAYEPRRLNRLLAIAMCSSLLVAIVGVAFKPASWFTQEYPPRLGDAAAAVAGSDGRVFANERYADWLVFEHPQLAGRIAYDSRFELLTTDQLSTITKFRNLVAGWRSTIRGYRVLVLDRRDDAQPIKALIKARAARVVRRKGEVVVLRQRQPAGQP
jgi:hypothetical protein